MAEDINALVEQISGNIDKLKVREKALKDELIQIQKDLKKYSESLKILKGKNQLMTPEERGARIKAGREKSKSLHSKESSGGM